VVKGYPSGLLTHRNGLIGMKWGENHLEVCWCCGLKPIDCSVCYTWCVTCNYDRQIFWWCRHSFLMLETGAVISILSSLTWPLDRLVVPVTCLISEVIDWQEHPHGWGPIAVEEFSAMEGLSLVAVGPLSLRTAIWIYSLIYQGCFASWYWTWNSWM
jgi:hypothetical protein